MGCDVEQLFICLFAMCIFNLVKCIFMSFAHFLIGLAVEYWEFFVYSRYESFVEYIVLKYFFLVCSLLFFLNPLSGVFHREKVFNFDEIQFIDFSFTDHAFEYIVKKNFLSPPPVLPLPTCLSPVVTTSLISISMSLLLFCYIH